MDPLTYLFEHPWIVAGALILVRGAAGGILDKPHVHAPRGQLLWDRPPRAGEMTNV